MGHSHDVQHRRMDDPTIDRLVELYGGEPPAGHGGAPLRPGDRVEFDIVQGPPGPRAVRVRRLPREG